ncbi:MAG: hypothetical protein KME50_30575 [Nostoc desertorum CM1-VF14]|jgi:hypothetical protein|nr:hypothetical protein [Nostoc desertorum CM1-VF14]
MVKQSNHCKVVAIAQFSRQRGATAGELECGITNVAESAIAASTPGFLMSEIGTDSQEAVVIPKFASDFCGKTGVY